MNKQSFTIALLVLLVTTFSGCAVIGGIFKAGVGVGVFIAVLVIAVIIFFISRMGKSK